MNADLEASPVEIDESIDFEDLLAQRGYEQGELGHDLESAGWSPPVIKRDGDGNAVAIDLT